MLGLLFDWLFCAPIPKVSKPVSTAAKPGGDVTAHEATVSAQSAAAGVTGTAGALVAAATAPASTDTDGVSGADTAHEDSSEGASKPEAEDAAGVADQSGSGEKPSTELSGDAELADSQEVGKSSEADPSSEPASKLKPSKPLSGEAELAERKGTWTYKKDGSPEGSNDRDPGKKEFDANDAKTGTDESKQPALLDAPRNGQPDNLKEIKGIGPKLEETCHSLGVYHFDQIAAWSDQEVAWVDANLQGFKGRVSRDEWRAQAKILASGEETAFSERVEKGGVY
ncbi:endonuclease [Sagittula sp. NFXS13]|uniref:endonuclease n=1 Tax=Sagittula sp. NFXS13 TaxID=2819095 RepID=UPI0032DF1BB2